MTERLYYRDSTTLDFTATVTSVVILDGRATVVLDRTAFYPTSGGQPHDLGDIEGVPVVDVVEAGSEVHHVLSGAAPPAGSIVRGRIDARRRIDHTQQHSGQHVLSQAFEQSVQGHTIAFHLGAETSTIDVDRETVTPDAIADVERRANQIVLEDRPVVLGFAQVDDVERFELRKVPRRTGEIRIVEIGDYDRSACGGTHVTRTGQIGLIKVRRTERRGGATRVEFLCGWRALRDYAMRLQATREIAERLSVADHEVRDAVFRSFDDLERVRNDLRRSLDQLLDEEANRLIAGSAPITTVPGVRVVRQTFAGRSADDLKRLALRIAAQGHAVALLGSSGQRNHLVFARSAEVSIDVAAVLGRVAVQIGARGGGTASLAQGGGPGGPSIDLALDAAIRLLEPQ